MCLVRNKQYEKQHKGPSDKNSCNGFFCSQVMSSSKLPRLYMVLCENNFSINAFTSSISCKISHSWSGMPGINSLVGVVRFSALSNCPRGVAFPPFLLITHFTLISRKSYKWVLTCSVNLLVKVIDSRKLHNFGKTIPHRAGKTEDRDDLSQGSTFDCKIRLHGRKFTKIMTIFSGLNYLCNTRQIIE